MVLRGTSYVGDMWLCGARACPHPNWVWHLISGVWTSGITNYPEMPHPWYSSKIKTHLMKRRACTKKYAKGWDCISVAECFPSLLRSWAQSPGLEQIKRRTGMTWSGMGYSGMKCWPRVDSCWHWVLAVQCMVLSSLCVLSMSCLALLIHINYVVMKSTLVFTYTQCVLIICIYPFPPSSSLLWHPS